MEAENTDLIKVADQLNDPDLVTVTADQLNALIAQNSQLKNDMGIMVAVFKELSPLFSGDVNIMSIVGVVTKLLKDKSKLAGLSAMAQVVEKYSHQPENSHE